MPTPSNAGLSSLERSSFQRPIGLAVGRWAPPPWPAKKGNPVRAALMLALLTVLVLVAWSVTVVGSAFASDPLFLTASHSILSFTGTSKLTLLRSLRAGIPGTIDCEKSTSSGEVWNKSTLVHRIELEFSGKCEQVVAGIKEACTEPIKFKLMFAQLGLLTGSKKVALLLAPESGTELVKVTCSGSTSTIEGAVVAEFPETNAASEKQYNTSRSSLELVLKSENKNQNQAITSIELSGVSMTKVLPKVEGFFGGSASLESTQTISLDSGVSICTLSPTACGNASGGKEPTTLTTTLSGEGKEAAELTVLEGSKAKDKATLSGKNAGTATGKVKYAVYSDNKCEKLVTAAGEVTVTSGSVPASSEEELEAGKAYYWQATYEGDSLNSSSTSTCGSEVLYVKAKTSITTSLSGEGKEGTELTILEGSKAKDKATLSGTNSSTASGKLVYKVYSDSKCETLYKEAGEVTVSSGSVPASNEEELEGGRTYYWQAHYTGDSLHQESTSTCGKEILNIKGKTTLTTKLSGESKENEELTILEGLKAKDKATLSGTNSSTAGGHVVYKIYLDSKCEKLYKEAGEVTVTSGSVPASNEEELEGGRTYYWQATYKGDSLHQESTSTCGKEVLTIKAATKLATSLTDEEHSGETIEATEELTATDSATLSGTNYATAAGTVTYNVYTEKECKTLATEAGEVTVASGVVPSSNEETLSAGTYYWQATYSGDALHQESRSACGKEVETVKASARISTSLLGEGQSNNEISVVDGEGIKDDATFNGPGASKAGGTLTYDVYSDSECKTLAAEAGKVTVTDGEVPESTEEKLEPGTYYWQATYSGDANNAAETTACGTELALVNAATSLATTLTGGGEKGKTISVAEGTKITDEATLSGTKASKAGGMVAYAVYSESECKTLVVDAGHVTVTEGVVPPSSEEELSPGTYYWQAFYSGDSSNHYSTSGCEEAAIVKATTSLGSTLSSSGKSHEKISVLKGAGVTDHATLTGGDVSKAGGTITYDVYSDSECKTLAAEAGKVTVTDGEVPESTEEKLEPGTYYWQATYSGDTYNLGSSGTCGAEILTVNKTLMTTSLSGEGKSGEEIEVANGAVHDTATLSGENAALATGKVEYDIYSDKDCKELVTKAGEVSVSEGLVPDSEEETLAPGTYYWQATYSGDVHTEGSTSSCGTEVAVVGPASPQVEQVNFTNNLPVLIDHQTNSTSEKAEAIEEFAGHNNVEWEYLPASHELLKSWPVAYVQETTPTIKARFEMPSSTKELILEKRIEGKPLIIGETKLDGETLKFTKEFATAEELETQEKEHAGYIEVGVSSPIAANKALPGRVGHEVMTIEWTWTVKLAGTSELITESLGSSQNDLYLTFAEPSSPPCSTVEEAEDAAEESVEKEIEPGACTPIFFTPLDLASKNIEEGKPAEAQIIAGVWTAFSKAMKERFLPPNPPPPARPWIVANPQILVPLFGPRIIDPRRPPPNNVFNATIFFRYYLPVFPFFAADIPVVPRDGCGDWIELLQRGVGRCGAWAELLRETLRSEGAQSARVVHLMVNEPRIAKCKIRPGANNEPFVCSMLVRTWGWRIGIAGPGFPFQAAQVTDLEGKAGQGNENPPPFFWDHAIVKAGKKAEGSQALYDPSYGTGPWPINLKNIEEGRAAQPTETEVLTEYQLLSIDGFCEPDGNARQQQPARCRQEAPGAELQLKAVGDPPGFAPTTVGWEP